MTVDVKKYNFGLIGMGFLGTAIMHGFGLHAHIKAYDKFLSGYDTIDDVVDHADFIWMCLPTPMNLETGEIDLSILDENIKAIHDRVSAEDNKIVIIKSTVIPGTTRKFAEKYPKLKFIMNPEFLTARNNKLDFICQSRIIIGGESTDLVTCDRLEEVYRYRFGDSTPIYRCGWEEAELTKYGANCFFTVKISYFNFIYSMCEKLSLDFEEVRDMILADGRIGRSHANVPGWDGQRGYSGPCLVAGSSILTDKCFKNIEFLEVGDSVYDGSGFTNVNRIASREVDSVVEVKARGRKIKGSKDHIHMVVDNNDVVEKKLEDITTGDWFYIPKPGLNTIDKVYIGKKPKQKGLTFWIEEFTLTREITRIMGLYAGDGFSGIYGNGVNKIPTHTVSWTFGKHEEHLADEVVNTLDSIGIRSNKYIKLSEKATFGRSETWCVRARSRWLYTFFNKAGLGSCAHNKDAPLLSGRLAEGFISGWLDADGSYYKKTGTISGFSRSTTLINKIDAMLLNMGICGFLKKDGQEINISTRHNVKNVSAWMTSDRFLFDENRYVRKNAYASPSMKQFKDGWAVKVRSVNIISEKSMVYSIETDSELYTANMFLTHNCFPKDINAMIEFAKSIGVDPGLLEASWEQNLEDRPSKDWEGIKSAVSNKK